VAAAFQVAAQRPPGSGPLPTGQSAPWTRHTSARWEQRPPPDVTPGVWWREAPSTAAELTVLRGQLYAALRDGPLAIDADADADAVEAVLLAFEELASNGLRHGRPTVHVTVTSACPGWLLEVSDDDADQPPAPAVDRDAAHGRPRDCTWSRGCAPRTAGSRGTAASTPGSPARR
jgi:hypothetical protein